MLCAIMEEPVYRLRRATHANVSQGTLDNTVVRGCMKCTIFRISFTTCSLFFCLRAGQFHPHKYIQREFDKRHCYSPCVWAVLQGTPPPPIVFEF